MNMRITERMRLVNDEILQNQVTIDDPEYLTKAWTWTWMYKPLLCDPNRYTSSVWL